MKKITHLAVLVAAVLSLNFLSCKYELVAEPTVDENEKKSVADYSDSILPPTVVSASHGGYRSITVSWEAVENAIDYVILAADTPFDNFTQIAETNQTSYTISEEPGVNRYFAVSAINYYGTVSAKSIIVLGTSMATPIITSITENNSATAFNVNWWMDNCDETTYQKDVQFTIKVYDSKKQIIDSYSKIAAGTERNISIEGLSTSTTYNFQVEAELLNSDQKKEISDMTTAESAHKITPNAPVDFSVTKGTSTTAELSWKLPDSVWYKEKIYQLNPVYFNIYRKQSSESDYHLLTTIGVEPNDGWGDKKSKAEYYFNCETEKVTNANDKSEVDFITIKKNTNGSTMDSPFGAYTSGSLLTYTDKTILRGISYDYYIRSYTDCVPSSKEMTDETSVTETVSGWGIAQPYLNIHQDNTYTDENTISTSTAKFDTSAFQAFSTEYTYLLTRTEVDENEDEQDTKILKQTNNFAEITDFTDSITTDSTPHYYNYNLYILEKTDSSITNVPSSYIECVEGSMTLTVINDPSKLPVIENFTVTDGYSNKYVITWKKVDGDNVSYKIQSKKYKNGLFESDADTIDLDNTTAGTPDGDGIFTYEYTAASGDSNKFSLQVKKGDIKVETSLDAIFNTLGTPVISFTEYEFDSINVTWPEVQMASTADETTEQKLSKYTVSASYNADSSTELTTAENTTITYDETTKLYVCKINKPEGYDISTKSGLPITLKVKVSNAKDNTIGTKEVRTLGPAEMILSTNSGNKSFVSVSWTPAIAADKYLIYRIMYSSRDKSTKFGVNKLIVNASTLKVEEENSQETENRSTCEYNSISKEFIFTDSQYDSNETFGYQYNQERIQWGYPIAYYVFPLKNDSNYNTIDFDYDNTTVSFKSNSEAIYESEIFNNLVYASTVGYGFNVHATKSESGSEIKITWEKPNDIENPPCIYRMPYNQTKNYDYGNNWTRIDILRNSDTEFIDKTISSEKSHLAYVYAVQYDTVSDFVRSYRTSEQALGKLDTTYTSRYEAAARSAEPNNKGYLFSIPNVEANPIKGTYKEIISWKSNWDFAERALCPSSFKIDLKNKNLYSTKDWKTIAEVKISPTGEYSFTPESTSSRALSDDIKVTQNGISSLTIEPLTFTTTENPTETTGLLCVARDICHYYSFNITADEENYDRQCGDNRLYTLRELTDIELVKCVNLIIADALYQASIPTVKTGDLFTKNWGSNYLEGYKGNGKLTVSHYGGVGSGDLSRWSFGTNYVHQFLSGGPADTDNIIISKLSLSSTISDSAAGIKDYKLYHLPELTITVNNFTENENQEILTSLQNRKIRISVGESGTTQKYTLKISLDGTSVVNIDNDENSFMKWFPYYLNNKISATPITSYNSSCPLYMVPQESDNAATKAWKTWWN